MLIIEALILWIFNSFKCFSYFIGASLILYLFSKDKHKIDNAISAKTIIQCLLLIQPLAIAFVLNHYQVEANLIYIICVLASIPGLITICKHD